MTEENKGWLWRPPEGGAVGQRGLRPKEAPPKVSGKAVYTNDIYLPGMLYAKIYRSPYAHARIVSMDTSKAEALPGVKWVLRYDDPDADLADPFKPFRMIFFPYFIDSILPGTGYSYGQRVGAMVVAESEEICDEALKLINENIIWEELPFILDPEEAASPNAPVLQPEMNPDNNIYKDNISYEIGDVEQGFANADHIVEFSQYKYEDDVWAGVEPGCVVAQYVGDGIEFWYHGQFVGFEYQNLVTPAFKQGVANRSRVKAHTPPNGGSFGGNSMGVPAHLTRFAALAAKKTGKPVKVVDDYLMSWEGISFETGAAHLKVGFNEDGTIVAMDVESYQHNGLPIVKFFVDIFKCPNVRMHEIGAYWSKAHTACWRDGAVNVSFANLVTNRVAAELGKDPIEIQMLNDGIRGQSMAELDQSYKAANGLPIVDSLKEVVEAGKAAIDWDNKWHAPGTKKLPNGKMHGVAFYATNAWDNKPGVQINPGIMMGQDGSAKLLYRRCDTGTSAQTTYCQIVAAEIGLPYDRVEIEYQDYAYFEATPPAGSFGNVDNSPALVKTARKMKKLLLEYALKPRPGRPAPVPSPFEGKSIEDLDIKDGIIFEKSNPDNSLPVSTVTSSFVSDGQWPQSGPFFVSEWFEPPATVGKLYIGRQAQFVEVEVDTDTGQVEVVNFVHAYDVGQSINPDINEQQLYGGAYQGVGVSGTEAIYYDPHTGVKLNDNLIDYHVLTILDIDPKAIKTPLIETHLGFAAYGSFGCSEAGKAVPAASLFIPAVYNAIGKWIENTPVTPYRVLEALGKA